MIGKTIDELIEMLREEDTRQVASDALGEVGERAVEPLISLLSEYSTVEDYDRDMNTHSWAEDALIKIGTPAVEPLIHILEDPRWGPRFGAIWCLKEIADPRAVLPLVEILKVDDCNVTLEVAEALLKIGTIAIVPLINALNHPNKAVRDGAAYILGRFRASEAVAPLIKLLEDQDNNIRLSAVYALESIGNKLAKQPLRRLVTILEKEAKVEEAQYEGDTNNYRATVEEVYLAAQKAVNKLESENE